MKMQRATHILRASLSFLTPFPQSYIQQHFLHVLSADVTLSHLQPR